MTLTKSALDALIKSDDDGLEDGQFVAYASVFGVKDSHGDVVQPDAFTTTLADWEAKGSPIPLLFGHNMTDPDYNVGHIVKGEQDERGLKVLGQIDLDSPKGPHVHRLIKSGRVSNLSFAYDVLDAAPAKSDQHGDYQSLKSLALHEVSIVPIGANRDTAFVSVKSGQPATDVQQKETPMTITQQRAEAFTKAQELATNAKSGDLTDEQKTELSGLVEQVKAFDAQIAKSLSSTALVDAVAALGGEPAKPADAPKSAKVLTKGFLALTGSGSKAAAEDAATKMLGAQGAKGLVAAGKVPFGVPMVAQSPLELDRIPTSLLDVLSIVKRDVPVWEYLQQTVRTTNAAPVATGDLKPTSLYSIDKVPGRLEVIAHMSEALDRYTLIDNSSLEAFVRDEMLFGLRTAVERQVISGNGTSPQLKGILNTSGILAQLYADDLVSTTRRAITQLEASGRTPGVFVLSPADWEKLELFRNGSGAFDLAHTAIDRAQQKLHGVRVVLSNALPAKTGLLLDLDALNVDTDTHGLVIENGVTGDMFGRNQSCILVEGRFGLSVTRPSGIVKIATAVA